MIDLTWLSANIFANGLLTTIKDKVVLTSTVSETLTAIYRGLGIYRAQRAFSVAEVGERKEYVVSFLFTDLYNNFSIDKSETSYPLVAVAPH